MVTIKVNTECFIRLKLSLQEIVDKFGEYVDGFEFALRQEDLPGFIPPHFPKEMSNSIHLCLDQGKRFTAFDELRSAVKALNAQYVVFHPDQIELLGEIPSDITFFVENMDLRKNSFRTIKEVLELVDSRENFGFNFDVCHLEEQSPGLTEKTIDSFRDKIGAMHISVPENENGDSGVPHHFCFNSHIPLPKGLPRDVPWTIEAIFFPHQEEDFKKEVEFLRKY